MGDGHDDTTVIGELGDEQPVLDERIDKFVRLVEREVLQARTFTSYVLVPVVPDADEFVEYFGQLFLDIVGQVLEDRLGPLGE